MGPIHSRNPSSTTTVLLWKSTLWKTTCLALILAGCQGQRQAATPAETPSPTPAAAPAATLPSTDRVQSVAEADGAVQVLLPGRPDLHPGDALHIRDGERLVATALVTAADDRQARARVIALTDQRRPVRPGDRFGQVPTDTAPAGTAPTTTAAEISPAEAPPAEAAPPATTATAAEHPSPESAAVAAMAAMAAVATAASAHPAEAPVTDQHSSGAAEPVQAGPEPAHPPHPEAAGATSAVVAAPESASPALTPEVRARLEAERAYWELAARVLRLPAGGAELTALQLRLRNEITALGAAP